MPEIVEERLEALAPYKTQRDISEELGFSAPTFISNIKNGHGKLPLTHVEPMAKALEVDVRELMIEALRQYYPEDIVQTLMVVFSDAETDTERDILRLARENMDVTKNLSRETRLGLKGLFTKNKPVMG